MRSLPYTIFVFLSEWRQVSYLNFVWLLFTYFYECTLTLVVCVNSIILRIDLNSFLFVDIYVIYLVMHNYVRRTVSFPNMFLQGRIIFVCTCSLARINDEVEHPWCLSSHS